MGIVAVRHVMLDTEEARRGEGGGQFFFVYNIIILVYLICA